MAASYSCLRLLVEDNRITLILPFYSVGWTGEPLGTSCLPSRPGETLGLSTEHAGMEYFTPEVRAKTVAICPEAEVCPPSGVNRFPLWPRREFFLKDNHLGIFAKVECNLLNPLWPTADTSTRLVPLSGGHCSVQIWCLWGGVKICWLWDN